MSMELAITFLSGALGLLAACVPVTAAIIKRAGPTNGNSNGNGKYVTLREFDTFREGITDRLSGIEDSIRSIETLLRARK